MSDMSNAQVVDATQELAVTTFTVGTRSFKVQEGPQLDENGFYEIRVAYFDGQWKYANGQNDGWYKWISMPYRRVIGSTHPPEGYDPEVDGDFVPELIYENDPLGVAKEEIAFVVSSQIE